MRQLLLNGTYVHFLKGVEGTVFVDHLKKPLAKYTKNEKLNLRVVMVDLTNKIVSLSEKEHLAKFAPIKNLPQKMGSQVDSAVVTSEAYGGSYFLSAPEPNKFTIFLHV